MARNPADRRGGIWLKTIIFTVVLAGGLGAAFVIVQPMLMAPSSDVVLIKADPGPFRQAPKDPGGTRILHKDSTVMSMLGGGDDQEDVEIIQPPADVPEMPPLPDSQDKDIVMAEAPAPVDQLADDPSADKDAGETADNDGETAGMTAPDTPSNDDDSATTAVTPQDGDEADDNAEPEMDSSQTDARNANTPEMATLPEAKPEPPQRVTVGGDEPLYLVQLAAFRNAGTAREQAALLLGKHESRLGEVELGTMKVDAGENGIFWRVITEPLERVKADTLCAALKRAGQDCILRKFDGRSPS